MIEEQDFNWSYIRSECEYCGDRKVYFLLEDNASLMESKTIDVSPSHSIVIQVPSKDRWCEWDCGAILTKPFITIDDRVMCNECAKEYNQEKGW
jgi:hypothetical protein